jgi:hypothetical protein
MELIHHPRRVHFDDADYDDPFTANRAASMPGLDGELARTIGRQMMMNPNGTYMPGQFGLPGVQSILPIPVQGMHMSQMDRFGNITPMGQVMGNRLPLPPMGENQMMPGQMQMNMQGNLMGPMGPGGQYGQMHGQMNRNPHGGMIDHMGQGGLHGQFQGPNGLPMHGQFQPQMGNMMPGMPHMGSIQPPMPLPNMGPHGAPGMQPQGMMQRGYGQEPPGPHMNQMQNGPGFQQPPSMHNPNFQVNPPLPNQMHNMAPTMQNGHYPQQPQVPLVPGSYPPRQQPPHPPPQQPPQQPHYQPHPPQYSGPPVNQPLPPPPMGGGQHGGQHGGPYGGHNMGAQQPLGQFGDPKIKDIKPINGVKGPVGKGGGLGKLDFESYLEGSYLPLIFVIILAFVLKIR